MIFVVSIRGLTAFHEDLVWFKCALECRSVEALQRVIEEFAQEKGFVIKDLDAPEVAA